VKPSSKAHKPYSSVLIQKWVEKSPFQKPILGVPTQFQVGNVPNPLLEKLNPKVYQPSCGNIPVKCPKVPKSPKGWKESLPVP